MVPFAVGGIQMHVGAFQENLTAMKHRLDLLTLKFPWVQMAVFSELAPYGPLLSHVKDYPHPDIPVFQEWAKKYNLWLIPGSMFERVDGKIYNTSVVINPQGELVGRYRKMFPFRPYEADVEAGTEFLVFDVPDVGRFGLSICYDIWFPETTRTLTSMGVEVLIHPVLTGTIDREVELNITRATAAMFQCFIVDINGLSAGGNGRSCLVNPAGRVLHQSAGQEDLLVMEIDLQQVRRQRETGIMGLGQPLKSFRDRDVDFAVYDRASGVDSYLHSLGELSMPKQGSRAGLDAPPPEQLQKLEAQAKALDEAGIEVVPGKGTL